MSLKEEISKRKTFAVIAHPDSGKTTLTEKLLLFGGAIQTAGAVKSNKIKKSTTSDFMEIEKQRGISVATSVMAFEYADKLINILDTPGHKDFAEDTYRTLTAVDSVILVIDCVKGVEEQTERLMEVCRMRNTPVIVFINKLDRDGRDPYDLLGELDEKLNIHAIPLTWPIGMGTAFKGVYNLAAKELNLFQAGQTQDNVIKFKDLATPELDKQVGKTFADQLREDVELIDGVYGKFDPKPYLAGKVAPVFFGSAVNNFGVKEMLDIFIDFAPNPVARETQARLVEPTEDKFTGFVFKIHANLDPKHRDRIAFLRVCSGKFERNTFYQHTRQNKKVRFNNPTSFMAQKKSIIDEAFPGDVIGLYDTGTFKIGDTLTEGEELYYKGIPSFSPELFREVINKDPMKSKQLDKGVEQLSDEGVAQLFIHNLGNRKIIGTVGQLQFEVIQYRLLNEYGASAEFRPLNYYKACWIKSNNEAQMNEFKRRKHSNIVQDKEGNDVFLADSAWILKVAREDFPEINFYTTSDFKVDALANEYTY
ncbi:MAG: peptide chain release factor 3 [Chitinophagales bacterium]|nr:peptide chain release factor 3 [Chitinophagales bacterium]